MISDMGLTELIHVHHTDTTPGTELNIEDDTAGGSHESCRHTRIQTMIMPKHTHADDIRNRHSESGKTWNS